MQRAAVVINYKAIQLLDVCLMELRSGLIEYKYNAFLDTLSLLEHFWSVWLR